MTKGKINWPEVVWEEIRTDRGKTRKAIAPIVGESKPICIEGRTGYYNVWKIPFECNGCGGIYYKNYKTYRHYFENKLPMYCAKKCQVSVEGYKFFDATADLVSVTIDGVSYETKREKGRTLFPQKCHNVYCGKIFWRKKKPVGSVSKTSSCSKECSHLPTFIANKFEITVPEYHNLHRMHYTAAQKNKNNKRYDCDLTLEEVVEVWKKQKGKCAITGVDLSLRPLSTVSKRTGLHRNKSLFQSSLDRKDNEKGYTKSNIHIVALGYNYLKNDLTDEEAMNFIKLIKVQNEI